MPGFGPKDRTQDDDEKTTGAMFQEDIDRLFEVEEEPQEEKED